MPTTLAYILYVNTKTCVILIPYKYNLQLIVYVSLLTLQQSETMCLIDISSFTFKRYENAGIELLNDKIQHQWSSIHQFIVHM